MYIGSDIAKIIVKYWPEYKYFVLRDGGLVVRLERALYGTDDAPLLWNKRIDGLLKEIGLIQSVNDSCIYYARTGEDKIIVTLFVDDFYIAASSQRVLDEFNSKFSTLYPTHTCHTGNTLMYLGMRITYNKKEGTTTVEQFDYINKLLERFGIIGESKYPSTLGLFEDGLQVDDHNLKVDKMEYMSRVMSLLYLAKRTRPDILKDVTFLAGKNHDPTRSDWIKLNKLLAYVNYSKDRKLVLRPNGLVVCMYVDASYMSHPDFKGHTGGIITFGPESGLMVAHSRKQRIITRSSTESELVAIDEVKQYATFCANLLSELSDQPVLVRIFEDNQSTIAMVRKGESNNISTKHIAKRYYMLKEDLDQGKATIEYLDTDDMLADLLTKPMTGEKFTKFTNKILGEEWKKK
jgi:Reverse transcriptase (RNA-dependent DNA polymerase)